MKGEKKLNTVNPIQSVPKYIDKWIIFNVYYVIRLFMFSAHPCWNKAFNIITWALIARGCHIIIIRHTWRDEYSDEPTTIGLGLKHSLAWATAKSPHYIISTLAAMVKLERDYWDFPRGKFRPLATHVVELGTRDTPLIVWELWIRGLEEEG